MTNHQKEPQEHQGEAMGWREAARQLQRIVNGYVIHPEVTDAEARRSNAALTRLVETLEKLEAEPNAEDLHFVMSHPEAVARQMTRDRQRITELEAEVEDDKILLRAAHQDTARLEAELSLRVDHGTQLREAQIRIRELESLNDRRASDIKRLEREKRNARPAYMWVGRMEYKPANLNQALGYLVEEAGEVLAAAGKSQRWGLASTNPELPPEKRETNEAWLIREMEDLARAIEIVREQLAARAAEGDGG